MARQEVQSLLWYMLTDTNYALLAANGYTGLDFTDLPALRDRLQAAFAQAQDDAAEAIRRGTEATPEATGEATAEATDTAAATTEPTVEVAPAEATEAATEAPAEATSEATTEPTAEATAEATAAS
jgi:hypothetical protein